MPDKVSGNPKVFAEAAKRKKGGKVCGPVGGDMAKKRMDRPQRASGGRVGSDKNPLSSAHNTSRPSKSAD
jgi:hypothetical protein